MNEADRWGIRNYGSLCPSARHIDLLTSRMIAARAIAKAIIDYKLGAKAGGDNVRMPNLQGVGPALAKLQGELEADAQKFLNEVEGTRARGQVVFTDARKQVMDAHKGLSEINSFITDLDKATNGGPTLGDSEKSPDVVTQPPPDVVAPVADKPNGGEGSPIPLAERAA